MASAVHKLILARSAAIIVLMASLAVGTASAAPETAKQGITISPTVRQLSLSSGLLKANATVKVTNETSHIFVATAKLVDFKSIDKYGNLSLSEAGVSFGKAGLSSWMSLPGGSNVVLAPGQSTDLDLTIDNRADLTPGGHYGAVVLSASSNAKADSNMVGFNQNLASLFFVKKLGGEQYGLRLNTLKPSGSGVPTSVTMNFSSTGNVYVIPRGYLEVLDPHGKLVAKGIINEESRLIMQGDSEELISLMKPVADASASGRYSLVAHYRYEGAEDYQTKTIYFEKKDYSIFAIVGGVLTGVVLLFLMYLAHHKRHHGRKKPTQHR